MKSVADISMSDPIERSRKPQHSELAAFAATQRGGRLGYGVAAFWIVVAVLLAARIAFLDPSKIEPAASLFGAKGVSIFASGDSPSPKD